MNIDIKTIKNHLSINLSGVTTSDIDYIEPIIRREFNNWSCAYEPEDNTKNHDHWESEMKDAWESIVILLKDIPSSSPHALLKSEGYYQFDYYSLENKKMIAIPTATMKFRIRT